MVECTGSFVINDHKTKLPTTGPTTDSICLIFFSSYKLTHKVANLPSVAVTLQHRSALLRPVGGAKPADSLPVAAGGDGRLLPEGRGAAARDAEPDLHRDDALHGDPGSGDLFTLHVPTDRSVGAGLGV